MANYNGINKGGTYPTRVNNKMSVGYMNWSNMLRRCNQKDNKKYKTVGFTVCFSWYEYQTFGKWFYLKWQPGLKMILKEGETIYSPENCEFLQIKKPDK